jgi:lipid-A-disaccharide synthase
MMRTPFVMVYRVSPLTYLLGKPRVKVPRFAMVNLIAGEQVVPELVQQDLTAANVVAELRKIMPDGAARKRMLEGLTQVKAKLRAPASATGDTPSPADRAAAIILSIGKRDRQIVHQTIEKAGS